MNMFIYYLVVFSIHNFTIIDITYIVDYLKSMPRRLI